MPQVSGSWICNGRPRDGKTYRNSPSRHDPYENFGERCPICHLPKTAVAIATRPTATARRIAIGSLIAFGTVGLLGSIGYGLLNSDSCSPGDRHPDGTCEALSSPSPTSPTPTATPVATRNFHSLSPTYRKLADVPNVPRGLFAYGGATTFAPLHRDEILDRLAKTHPDFTLRYTEPPAGRKPGSDTGIQMLLAGQLSFAHASRPVKTAEFVEAATRGFTLEQVAVAFDGIAIYVHPELEEQVPGLTLQQVEDIFSGKIANWNQVGGPDLEVKVFSRNPEAGGTVQYLIDEVLKGTPLALNYREVRDTTESLRRVGATPGGIGYATASTAINQSSVKILPISAGEAGQFISPCTDRTCRAIDSAAFADGSYPMTRRVFVVLKRDGRLDERAGRAYINLFLSDEGQQLVERSGLVPLR
ncbi:MAG: PstS family phosphate ABC transporter substrate-binding protein [Cyanobacteriota bacterium]|nr:PstS family phosphate ABC transporter substrate-binding protein [Cyanobacteriota bacterium]